MAGAKLKEENVLLDPWEYIQTYYNIRSKDRDVIPFILNPVQKDYLANRSYIGTPGRGCRDLIFKGRQHGFSTLKLAEYMHDTTTNEGVSSVIVGHDDKAMEILLQNARMMYQSVPTADRPRIKYDSKQEMYFPGLNSRMYISTYRKLKLRSQTINNLLLTEVAFWKGVEVSKTVSGMTESVPMDGNICWESTPGGIGGLFWEMVTDAKKGRSVYKLFMYPWFVNPEYYIPRNQWSLLPPLIRPEKGDLKLDLKEKSLIKKWNLRLEQIMWRRYKMLSLGDMRVADNGVRTSRRFAQEHECSFTQSGHTVFDPAYLIPSCVYRDAEKGMKCVAGADSSEGVPEGEYSVLYISDLETGETVHKIRGLWKPKEFARRIHKTMMKYGGLIGVEANNTGIAVLQKLEELWYEEGKKLGNLRKMPYRIYSDKRRLGWWTGANRKILFVDLDDALKNQELQLAIEDENGIEELTACIYNDKMKEEHPPGMTDDSIIAMAIMWQMRKYYRFYFRGRSGKESGVSVRTF